MKVRLGNLRKVIREEYMRSVPEFVLKQATTQYIDTIRRHMQKHILQTQKDPASARRSIELANKTLEGLEEDANQLLEDRLWQWIQNT